MTLIVTGAARWPLTAWFLANCVGMAISFYGSRSYAFKPGTVSP